MVWMERGAGGVGDLAHSGLGEEVDMVELMGGILTYLTIGGAFLLAAIVFIALYWKYEADDFAIGIYLCLPFGVVLTAIGIVMLVVRNGRI